MRRLEFEAGNFQGRLPSSGERCVQARRTNQPLARQIREHRSQHRTSQTHGGSTESLSQDKTVLWIAS